MRKLLMVCLGCLLIDCAHAQADPPPVPRSKKESLDFEEKLKEEQQQKDVLARTVKEIEQDLGSTRGKLVEIARSIRNNESTLAALEDRIAKLEIERSALEKTLKDEQKSISHLILALERIRRTPPEALILKPGAPLKTAQSAMLMRDIIPAIQKQASMLRHNLESLDQVSSDLTEKKQKALETSQALKEEHNSLSTLLDKREKLFASTHNDLQEQEQNIQRISAQAKSLQDLVRGLENERISGQSKKSAFSAGGASLPNPGQAQFPVSGIVRVRYDEPDAFGAPSKGISIEARGGALVVAPMGGIVRFAGQFKNYGNMVILEHKNGYHSLIAGLEKIDTVVGQSVGAGEPIGLLHHASAGEKPALYYELRLKGQSVNPALKFSDLG